MNLIDIPAILVTAEISYHAGYSECTFSFLRQLGVDVEWHKLADHGVKGDGHTIFMALNSLKVAQLLDSRIAQIV